MANREATPEGNPLIVECRGLSKSFGARGVLSGFEWQVRRGSFALLLGPADVGKTTLWRVLLGFSPADEGTARLFGEDCATLSKATRQRFAYAPQLPGLPDWMRAAQLATKHAQQSSDWDAAIFQRASALLELAPGEPVYKLDARRRRSLGIALALGQRAELTVLDEPFSGLEGPAQAELAELLAELARDPSRTLIASSREVGAWTRACGTACVLRGGRSVLFGAIDELCSAAREVVMPLERYVQVAARMQRAGVLSTRTEELVRHAHIMSLPSELDEALAGIEGSQVRPVDLAGLYAAAIDVSSTGTGTAPE